MDGADISDPEMGGSIMPNFNVDAIQELQSSSGWMPADYRSWGVGFHKHHHSLRSGWLPRLVF